MIDANPDSAIWRRHPEFTARQVIRNLGPKHQVTVPWVQKILREVLASLRQAQPSKAADWAAGL